MRPDWEDLPYIKTPEMIERDRKDAHDRERARLLHEKAVERRKKAKKTRTKRKKK